MRPNLAIFIGGVLSSLLILPLVNILSTPVSTIAEWRSKSFLTRIDALITISAAALVPMGISVVPRKVIVGEDRWLFLGDEHQKTATVDRKEAALEDIEFGQEVGIVAQSWDRFLSERGVRIYRILVGPNKNTVYPSKTPDWLRAGSPSVMDAFFEGAGSNYVDVRQSLLDALPSFTEPVYYRTDTHWNFLGASVAFSAFAAEIAELAPDIRLPSEDMYRHVRTLGRVGGDLSAFMYLQDWTRDIEPWVAILDADISTTQTDWASGEVLFSGKNLPVSNTSKPIHVHSEGALNQRKVLWLRDSFGSALSPFMAATFSDVLQVHWANGLGPGVLDDLVARWQPEFVFVTVVERAARDPIFTAPPPLVMESAVTFKPTQVTRIEDIVYLEPDGASDRFTVTGNDPHWIFEIDQPLPEQVNALRISIKCSDGIMPVPVQLFWSTQQAPNFDEAHSLHFNFDPQRPILRLDSIPKEIAVAELKKLRLDISQEGVCLKVQLLPPEFGAFSKVFVNKL